MTMNVSDASKKRSYELLTPISPAEDEATMTNSQRMKTEALLKKKVENEGDAVLEYASNSSPSREAFETLHSLAFHVKALQSLLNHGYDGGTQEEGVSAAVQSVNLLDEFLCAAQVTESDDFKSLGFWERRRAFKRVRELVVELYNHGDEIPCSLEELKPVEEMEALLEAARSKLEIVKVTHPADERRMWLAEGRVFLLEKLIQWKRDTIERTMYKKRREMEKAAYRKRIESYYRSRYGIVVAVIEDET
jgi:hypothetical protein